MWCDNCDYEPSKIEERYMICPKCNKLVQKNLPIDRGKTAYVYAYSLKIIHMKRILTCIFFTFLFLYFLLNFYFSNSFYSQHIITGDSSMSQHLSELSRSSEHSTLIIGIMTLIPNTIFMYFFKNNKLSRTKTITIIVLYILLNVIIFKIFTDAYIQDFYNKNMAYLKKIIDKSSDYDKWYSAIKKEMSLIKVYVFNLSFISIIFSTVVFSVMIFILGKITRLQDNLLEEFSD